MTEVSEQSYRGVFDLNNVLLEKGENRIMDIEYHIVLGTIKRYRTVFLYHKKATTKIHL